MFINTPFIHMLLNKPFILASNSASRYRLLKNAGLNFKKLSPACNEEKIKKKLIKRNIDTRALPKLLAKEKALSVSLNKTDVIVVGCDTIIIYKNKVINKANTFKEAEKKLKKLSGNKHQIISAVSVCYKNKQIWSYKQSSTIHIKKLNSAEIKKYLDKAGKDILSSVGCYQAEKKGTQIIKSIKGDFFNVLGFPLFPFLSFLSKVKK